MRNGAATRKLVTLELPGKAVVPNVAYVQPNGFAYRHDSEWRESRPPPKRKTLLSPVLCQAGDARCVERLEDPPGLDLNDVYLACIAGSHKQEARRRFGL